MDTAEAHTVATLKPGGNSSGGACCELCGTSISPGAVCQPCALALFGLALEGHPAATGLVAPVTPATPALSARRYEHFAVCRRPDGSLWELGRGAMGITYRSFDTNLHCLVALKVINATLTGDPQARGRFLHEARSAARLRHPHVATILHLGQSGGEFFYAMEFIEGETLEALLKRQGNGLAPETALEIVMQTARALAAAHAETLVHRDIKPANIMLARPGAGAEGVQVKVIDFGLAKRAAEEHSDWCDWYFAGTPCYASPEQIAGSTVDARSDLYSLGVVWWHALAGDLAFRAAQAQAANADGGSKSSAAPTTPPQDWLESLPVPLRTLLTNTLAADPARRPATAEDWLARCEACRPGLAVSTSNDDKRAGRIPRVLDRPPWQLRTRRVGLFLIAVAAMLIIGGFLLGGMDGRWASLAHWTAHGRHAEALEAFHLGQALVHKDDGKNTEAAIDAFRDAIRLDPALTEAYAALAWALTQRAIRFGGSPQDLDLALSHAEHAITLAPFSSDGHLSLGLVQMHRGAQWESLSALRRAVELDPHNAKAMATFGLQWLMLGHPQRGLPWLLGSARTLPQVEYLGAALDAYIDLCADEQAEECGGQCEAMDPSRPVTYRQMCHLHLLQGNFGRARQDLLAGASLNPQDAFVRTLQAQLELYSGHFPEAEVLYRRLYTEGYTISLNFYGSMSYPSILGYLSRRAGRGEEAEKFLQAADALHSNGSDGPQSVYDLAAVRCLEGHREEALALLRKSVAAGWLDYRSILLDPRFEELREEESFIHLIEGLRARVASLREEALARAETPLNIADYPVTAAR